MAYLILDIETVPLPPIDDGVESSGMKTPCFTLQYAAPEVLDQAPITKALTNDISDSMLPTSLTSSETKNDGYNESCDLWSLGVILVIIILL